MPDDNTPGPLTMEQVQEAINKTVNGTVVTLKKQFQSDLAKGLEGSATAIGKLLDEKLSAFKPAEGGEGGEGGTPGKGKGKDLQIATLERRVNESIEATRLANEKAAKAEARRRQIERDNIIKSGLQRHGVVDPFKLDLALGHIERRKLADWSGDDEDSSVVWNVSDGVQVGFDDGIASFAKSEEFKHFLPPRGASGSGGKRPQGGPLDNGKKEIGFEDIGNAVLGLVSPLGGSTGRLGE